MRFKYKLLIVYLVLVVAVVSAFGAVFYVTSEGALERSAFTNLNVLAEKMSQQLDSLVSRMDFISLNLLSNGPFLSSMVTLSTIDRSSAENSRFISQAYTEINRALMNYTIGRDYYRVSMFNPSGDFLTSRNDRTVRQSNYRELIEAIPWTELVSRRDGRIVILPPYIDEWDPRREAKVFGVARTVRGMNKNVGCIEVQARFSDLERLFAVERDSRISVLAITREDAVLYRSEVKNTETRDFQFRTAFNGSLPATSFSVPGSRDGQIITVRSSSYTGIRILLAQDKEALLFPSRILLRTIGMIALSIVLLSFLYIAISGSRLTKPLQQLKEEIERTRFENLPRQIILSGTDDEIAALNTAFADLRERLSLSIDREIDSRNLHLRASFESLQARVNPHFIYNVLNVISNRGILAGDLVIYDVCQSVAAMLRYSTSTRRLTARLSDELDHVGNYLKLMKNRFEDRLRFSIEVEEDVLDTIVPKIILQPLVENALNHGFEKVHRDMNIRIEGHREGDRWLIVLTDNGQGFDPDVLRRLEDRMSAALATGALPEPGLGIGGMGILNVYSRLLLHFHKDSLCFRIRNNPGQGACITIGGIISTKEDDGDEDEGSSIG